ncbi:radical SAM/SPASM domain-containing protein [Methylophaga sp.]|uniref:radical SAM/SPASM domain-containing protein n=1 Tax=Methylophaga sp. TaxID=2024840 RepID=UPI003A9327CB
MKAEVKSKLNPENRVELQKVIPLESPFLLYVDPSSACNFRCQFCPTGHIDLIKNSDYKRSLMDLGLFEKLIDGLSEFSQPLKVMRMNKIGEPLLNKQLSEMIALAKNSGRVEHIDLATNGALFTEELLTKMLTAGLDRLNISLEGINAEQYLKHAKVKIDFAEFVRKIKWLYVNKGDCEVTIKVPGNYLTPDQQSEFYDTFGEHCDRIFVEGIAPIWPGFDVEERSGFEVKMDQGQYQQDLEEKSVCSYLFYAMAVNSDGTISACCPDWDQKLVIGDLKQQTIKQVWNSEKMQELRLLHLEGQRKMNPVCRDCGHIKYAQVDNIDPYKEVLLNKLKQSM